MVADPTPTQMLPFHATAFPDAPKIDVPRPVQLIPFPKASVLVPVPATTHKFDCEGATFTKGIVEI